MAHVGETKRREGERGGGGDQEVVPVDGLPCRLQLFEAAFYWEIHGGIVAEKLGLFL